MTPASAKPEMGRPGGGQRTSGCGPTPLPRPQHPVALPVSVLVCYWGVCVRCLSPQSQTHDHRQPESEAGPDVVRRSGTRLAAQRNVGGRDAPLRDRPRHRHQVWARRGSTLPAGGRTAVRGGGRARAGDARLCCRARHRARLHRHVRAACSPARSSNARPGTLLGSCPGTRLWGGSGAAQHTMGRRGPLGCAALPRVSELKFADPVLPPRPHQSSRQEPACMYKPRTHLRSCASTATSRCAWTAATDPSRRSRL